MIKINLKKIRGKPNYIYLCVAEAILVVIIISQYTKNGVLPGEGLLLGWDSPAYVWIAQNVLSFSPRYLIEVWAYPRFYVLLLAAVGYIIHNVKLAEAFIPVIFGMVFLYLLFRLARLLTTNVRFAGVATILGAFSLNFLRILADLHRNLMAIVLSYACFLLLTEGATKIRRENSFPP